jgi:hypothetical protein
MWADLQLRHAICEVSNGHSTHSNAAQTLYVTVRRDELRQLKDERDQLKQELAQLRLLLQGNSPLPVVQRLRTPDLPRSNRKRSARSDA